MEEENKITVCLVCLSTTTRLYSLKSLSLAATYTELTQLPLDAPALPLICVACAARMRNAKRLAEQCRRTNALLREVYERSLQITLKDVTQDEKQQLLAKYYAPNHCDLHIIADEDEDSELEDATCLDEPLIEYDDGLLQQELVYNDNQFSQQTQEKPTAEPPRPEKESSHHEGKTKEALTPKTDAKEVRVKRKEALTPKTDAKEVRVKRKEALTPKTDAKKVRVKRKEALTPKTDAKKVRVKRKEALTPKTDAKEVRVKRKEDLKNFRVQKLSLQEQIEEIQTGRLSSKYIESPFKCDYCFKGFPNEVRFSAHMAKHDESIGAYWCKVCHLRFDSAHVLNKHTAGHDSLYTCTECSFQTKHRTVVKMHIRQHEGTVFKCDQCNDDTVYKRQTNLLTHMRLHHACNHSCAFCGYSFSSERGLMLHQTRRHSKRQLPTEGPRCEECDKMFASEDVLLVHRKIQHERTKSNIPSVKRMSERPTDAVGDTAGTHKRRRRGKDFDYAINMKKTKQDGGGKEYVCDDCSESFDSLQVYRVHCRAAHGRAASAAVDKRQLRAQCHICGRLFNCQAMLLTHLDAHDPSASHPCASCGKAYKTRALLAMHRAQHAARYACPLCGKRFGRRDNRDRHYTYVHTTVKDVKCDYCPKMFKSVYDQRLHHQYLHLQKPWPKRVRRKKAKSET